MRIIVGNTASQVITGGKDNLLPVNLFEELYNYLSIDVPGARYSGNFGHGKWDGKRHFMNKKGVFATGYLPGVIKYALELGANIEIEDNRKNLPRLVQGGERVWEHFEGWEARDYQKDIVNKFDDYIDYGRPGVPEDANKMLYWPRGIADAATNAGKNSVICCLLKNIDQPRALLLIDSQEIFDQLVNFLKVDFPNLGIINSKKMEWGKELTIAMAKTLKSRMEKSVDVAIKVRDNFNTLIVDECHGAGADYYSKLIQGCNAGMRVLVSGSPLDSSNVINNMIVVGLSGPRLIKISKKELRDKGHSLPIKVTMHHNPTLEKGGDGDSYEEETRDGIHLSRRRVKTICEYVKANPDKKILINFIEIIHGELMYLYLQDAGIPKLDWVHGTDKERKKKLEQFKSGEIMVLVSSTILKQGINVPDINCLWYAQAGKALIPLKQWTGRIERHDGVSDSVELHDFWDNGKYLEKHSRKRIQFYKDEGFEIKYNYEQKRGRPVEGTTTTIKLPTRRPNKTIKDE